MLSPPIRCLQQSSGISLTTILIVCLLLFLLVLLGASLIALAYYYFYRAPQPMYDYSSSSISSRRSEDYKPPTKKKRSKPIGRGRPPNGPLMFLRNKNPRKNTYNNNKYNDNENNENNKKYSYDYGYSNNYSYDQGDPYFDSYTSQKPPDFFQPVLDSNGKEKQLYSFPVSGEVAEDGYGSGNRVTYDSFGGNTLPGGRRVSADFGGRIRRVSRDVRGKRVGPVIFPEDRLPIVREEPIESGWRARKNIGRSMGREGVNNQFDSFNPYRANRR